MGTITIDENTMTISVGEQRASIGLVFSAGIRVYFALNGAQMAAPGGRMAPAASTLGRQIVMLIIFWRIGMQAPRQRLRDAVERDERDRAIQARACNWARMSLAVFVIGAAVMFAFSPLDHLAWAKPMTVYNLLMFGLSHRPHGDTRQPAWPAAASGPDRGRDPGHRHPSQAALRARRDEPAGLGRCPPRLSQAPTEQVPVRQSA